MKKTILHTISDLKRGGAETILVTTVNELTEYNNIIVTLFEGNEFDEFLMKNCTIICLHVKHFSLLPFYLFRFRSIVKRNEVDLVHSRLFWPTLLARAATPRKTPLITTIHSYIANSVEYKKKIIRWVDKISYRFHKTIMLADSPGALNEYFTFLKLTPYKAVPFYTFVDPRIFQKQDIVPALSKTFKVITVGRLTVQKNHQYIIEVFRRLKSEPVLLDIYGMGDRHQQLKIQITETEVAVNLKGRVDNIQEIIAGYDLFIMPSLYEGFSLAVLEAMAMGMPIMLSDTESFREQCADTAVYFSLTDPEDFVKKFNELRNNPTRLKQLGDAARERVMNNFTLDQHMAIIRDVYKEAML
jgi:glycosyltransferase involved in cell wall biosynthesis